MDVLTPHIMIPCMPTTWQGVQLNIDLSLIETRQNLIRVLSIIKLLSGGALAST